MRILVYLSFVFVLLPDAIQAQSGNEATGKLVSLPLPATPTTSSSETHDQHPQKTLIDGIEIGPNATVLGFPHPFRLGLEVRVYESFVFSYEYGTFPKSYFKLLGVNPDEVPDDFSFKSHALGVRWRPWKGAFHVGFLLGLMNLTTPRSTAPASLPADSAFLTYADIRQTFLAPTIGWRWEIYRRFFLALDLGYQLPLSSHGNYEVSLGPSSAGTENAEMRDLQDSMKRIQTLGLPFISLVKLGWYF